MTALQLVGLADRSVEDKRAYVEEQLRLALDCVYTYERHVKEWKAEAQRLENQLKELA